MDLPLKPPWVPWGKTGDSAPVQQADHITMDSRYSFLKIIPAGAHTTVPSPSPLPLSESGLWLPPLRKTLLLGENKRHVKTEVLGMSCGRGGPAWRKET
jgi:hypothetical protein